MKPRQDSLQVGSSGLLGFLRPRKWKRRDVLHRPHEYGFTVEEAKLKVQRPCEICGRSVPVVFDHDHKNEDFRGMLCARCNTMIGFGWDLPWVFVNSALYLMKHEAEHESDPAEKACMLLRSVQIISATMRPEDLTPEEKDHLKVLLRGVLDDILRLAFFLSTREEESGEKELWSAFIDAAVSRYEHQFGEAPRVLIDEEYAEADSS